MDIVNAPLTVAEVVDTEWPDGPICTHIMGPAPDFHFISYTLVDDSGNEYPIEMSGENDTEEGRTIIAWGNQEVDITDDFVDGVCYVKLVNGDETRYITAHEGQGFSMSPYKFLEPTIFN